MRESEDWYANLFASRDQLAPESARMQQTATRQELHDYGSKSVVVIYPHNSGYTNQCCRLSLRQFFWTFRFHAVLREHFLWNVVNQKRVGNVIHRSKMLSQPSVLSGSRLTPDQGVDRHNNSTCLRLARIYDSHRDDGGDIPVDTIRFRANPGSSLPRCR